MKYHLPQLITLGLVSKLRHYTVVGKRVALLGLCVFYVASPASVAALTASQQNLLKSGIHYFDIAGTDCSASSTSSSTVLTGKDGIQKAFNYFKNAGLSDIQAAAVVGNLEQESSLNPTVMEKGGNSKNPADADNGMINGKPATGWGIAQWSPGSKIIGIAKDLNINGPIYELATQLDIVLAEMKGNSPTGYKDVYGGLQKSSSLADAVEFFRANFEGGTPGKRQEFAQGILHDYGGTAATGSGGGAVTGADAPSGCNTQGAVNCDNTTAGTADASTGGLSTLRQNVVCLTEAEYKLWTSGKMKAGTTNFYKYSQNRDEDWCADFASWIYNQAGYPLDNSKGGNVPAVLSIQQIGQNNGKFTYHSTSSGYTPVPGDLAIHIYGNGGHHVNIVISVNTNKKSLIVIGGNQGGTSSANTSSKVTEDVYDSYSSDSIVGYVSPKE